MDLIVSIYSSPYNYDDINEVKKNKVGLILGTSKYSSKGVVNLYYKNRIDATYKLFKSGKIEFVLISGDNSEIYYNEPITIQKDLIKKGIPEDKIFLDYAGFRTYDSIIRAKKIFGLNKLTIISQKFHNQRAIFISRFNNINAIAYNAKDVGEYSGLRTILREKLARVIMFFDLLFKREPKFLGDSIIIE